MNDHLLARTPKGTMGTFAGVFTPSVLTILGIILFLRLGYVVGNAGLGRALLIIAMANAISVLTSVSLSAIATNLKVKGGGDYYLISRTLGVEFGGALGIVLFLAQSVSIAFYCIGFGEALSGILVETAGGRAQIIAALAVSFLFIFAWLGADWATRLQYVVMSILAAALVSFFVGGLSRWDSAMLVHNWSAATTGPPFWVLFAIFFPAVTGFTQGVSMSGDLKDPGKSLPLGTFSAVGISVIVYFGVAIVFSAALPGDVLSADYAAMKRAAWFGFLIDAGVIAATISSAMASFLGAPRILQSLAADRVFPILLPFAKGYGPVDNPRRGVLLSAAIALATIALGNLNVIAPVVSMFFLISYGLLNYATYYEARTSSPSFRPRFRWFDKRLSLLGSLACLGGILAINLAAGAAAIAILFAVYQYLRRTAGPARWADSRRAYHLQRVREHLIAASSEPEHPRDWRPQLLAFSNEPARREQLLRFSSWLEGGSGYTTVVKIIEGDGARFLRMRSEAEDELRKDSEKYGINAFPLALVAPDLQMGIHTLVQGFGVGPIKANTVLLNWLDELPMDVLGLRETQYSRSLRAAFRFGCNIIILDADPEEWASLSAKPAQECRIDVWWWGDATSRLMLLFAYLMTRHDAWNGASIRVLAVDDKARTDGAEEDLQGMLEEVRITAKSEIVPDANADVIAERSHDADVVYIPFRLRGDQLQDPFGGRLEPFLSRLPVVALVLAAEDIELDAEPEEGKAGELAAALDALSDAEKAAGQLAKEARKATELAQKKIEEKRAAAHSDPDHDSLADVASAARKAEEEAVKAACRAAKAQAKVQEAAKKVESLGGEAPADERGSKNG